MPQTVTIESNQEFAAWLDAHTWFEDAEVRELRPGPAEDAGPGEITLLLTETLRGSYVAGTERVVRDVQLHATNVLETTLAPGLDFRAGNCCEGLDLLDVATGVGWRIDIPGSLDVRCSRLRLELGEERVERFEPWLSESEFGLTQPGGPTPPPDEWVRRFAAHGVVVNWRMYGDAEAGTPPHPEDYTGWHLQVPDRLTTSSGGLMFFACGQRNGAFVLHLRLWEHDPDKLREAAYKVIAGFPDAEVWCGNCRFSTEEWQAYLSTGRLPDRIRGGT